MPLYLTESDVDAVADMPLAIKAVEASLARQGRGESSNVGRQRARIPAGTLHLMGGADQELGAGGAKIYSSFTSGQTTFVVILFDIATGTLRAVIEAGRLGELRTGAATGVSSKHLARAESQTVGILGSGRQARTQLEAVSLVHDLEEVRVYSRDPDNVRSFILDVEQKIGVKITAASSPASALDSVDLVITSTTASTPILTSEHLEPGMHVVAMGSNNPAHAELTPDAIARTDRVFVDDLNGAQLECGDLIAAVQSGRFQWGQAIELGLVVAGEVDGRTTNDEITLFESQGIALWDISLAQAVLERASVAGRGFEIP